MKRKKSVLLVVLLMAVGFAAVSTTLYINGQTKINANQDDFNVYYSDALVNGVQDLSVITDDTQITFTTSLKTLGEKYVLDYDVTNGSKNYDAKLAMECSAGNDYLTVTNEFDTSTNLSSLATRSGKLTLELQKSYAGEEDMDVTITCEIDADAVERDNLGDGREAFALYVDKVVTAVETKYNNDINAGKNTNPGYYVYDITMDLDFSPSGSYRGYVVVDSQDANNVQYIVSLYDDNYQLLNYNVSTQPMPTADTATLVDYDDVMVNDVASTSVKACKTWAGYNATCYNAKGYLITEG